jgi:hypothetical protein
MDSSGRAGRIHHSSVQERDGHYRVVAPPEMGQRTERTDEENVDPEGGVRVVENREFRA